MALKKINDDAPLRLIREGNSSAEAARYLGVRVLGGPDQIPNPDKPEPKRIHRKGAQTKNENSQFCPSVLRRLPARVHCTLADPVGCRGRPHQRSGAGLYALHDISALSAGPETK